MSRNDGGPAFSGTYQARSDQGRGPVQEYHDKGMSLRDYFAAKAMQAIISNNSVIDRIRVTASENLISPDILTATAAYGIADAMLEARK